MNIFAVGGKFEFDWMWYIQSQGFFVRRALPLTSDSSVEDATDIDIWGIKFFPPLVHSIAVVDCRDRKKPRTYERILWTKGMAAYADADQVYVGPPKATWKVIDFGRQGGLHVMPYEFILRHLGSLPPERYAYGQAKFDLYKDFFAKRKSVLRGQPEIGIKLFEARNLYLLGSAITNINRAIEGLKASMNFWSHAEEEPEKRILWYFVCCEFITAFALNLIKVAEELFTLSEADRMGFVIKGLTYGDLPAKKAEEIVRLSHRLAIAYARQALPVEDRGKIPDPPPGLQGLEMPEYATTVHGLLERVIKNPMLYWEGLKFLEAILFDLIIQARNVTKEGLPCLDERFIISDVVKATKNYIAVVCDASGVSRKPFWVNLAAVPTDPTKSPPNASADQLSLQ